MNSSDLSPKKSSRLVWIGRILSILVMIPFLPSLYFKLYPSPQAVEGMAHLGFSADPSLSLTLAVLEGLCLLLYLIPQTSALGAVLFTGYLGGAISIHLRVGDPVFLPFVLGLFIWLGIYLREPRLRALLPFRR